MAKFSPISFLFRFNWASIRPRDFLKLPLILAKFHPSQSTAQAPEQVSSHSWVFSESNRHVLSTLEGRDRMLSKRGLPVITPKASSSSIALHDLAMLREVQKDLTCKIMCRSHTGDKNDLSPGSLRIIVSRSIVSRVGRLEQGEVNTLHIFVGMVDKQSMLFFSRILGALYISNVVSDCWTPTRHSRWFRQVLVSFGATERIADWRNRT